MSSFFYAPVLLVAELCIFFLLRRKGTAVFPFVTIFLALLVETGAAVVLALIYRVPGGINFVTIPVFIKQLIKDLSHVPFLFVEGPAGGGALSLIMKDMLVIVAIVLVLTLVFSKRIRAILKQKCFGVIFAYTAVLVLGPLILFSLMNDPTGPYRFYVWAAPTFSIVIAFFINAIPGKARMAAGSALILAIIIFAIPRVNDKKNWDLRDLMQIIAASHKSNDSLLCFPIHHCIVAASQYPPGLIPVGGAINGNTVGLFGWDGYLSERSERIDWISGNNLKIALSRDLAGSGRVWVVAGDGSSKEFPSVDNVYRALGNEWQESQSWNFTPYILKLFIQKGNGRII